MRSVDGCGIWVRVRVWLDDGGVYTLYVYDSEEIIRYKLLTCG